MQADEEEYIYNAFAPLLAPFGREVNAYKAEICSQFVAQCLRTAGVLPKGLCAKSVVLPKDFAEAFAEYLYYRGPLEHYRPAWAAAPAAKLAAAVGTAEAADAGAGAATGTGADAGAGAATGAMGAGAWEARLPTRGTF